MNNYELLKRNYTMMTDGYEFTMSYGYFKNNKKNEEAIFDVFFRKVPNNGGYAIMAGLNKVISYIQNLKFSKEDLEYFKENGYDEDFIKYLENFKFTGNIYAIPDGTPVFPNEPLITVKANVIEAQIIETCLLSIINGAMEHATAARRIIESTPKEVGVMEFGARRADGPEAAIDSSIYGIMAGCVGTSNVIAAKMLGMKAMGTMAHSYVESFDNEYDAFLTYATTYPNNAILLVDTYDTLRSGVINAIKVFDYMKENNISTNNIGIRIDSGDLSYLSKEARKMLDNAGYSNAKILLSNGLTAETIESLVREGAKFNSLGVGDNISKPQGRMGCVYKEVAITENGTLVPKIKLSNDTLKIVNPGYKKLYRLYDKVTGYALADVISEYNKNLPNNNLTIVCINDITKKTIINDFELVELQKPIFINGKLVYNDPNILEKREYCNNEMSRIYPEIKRIVNPHQYYVDGTLEYTMFRNNMISDVRENVKKLTK